MQLCYYIVLRFRVGSSVAVPHRGGPPYLFCKAPAICIDDMDHISAIISAIVLGMANDRHICIIISYYLYYT